MKRQARLCHPEEIFKHPLLAKLSDIAWRLTGIRFLIVFPKEDGWGQVAPGEDVALPRFCRLMQSTPQGAQRCRMCHVLMTIAACSKGLVDQRCHVGATVLVTPITLGSEENLAVLSTCTFRLGSGKEVWKEMRASAKQLGLSLKETKKRCYELPALSPEKLDMARTILAAAGEAAAEVRARTLAETKLRGFEGTLEAKSDAEAAVEAELKESLSKNESEQGIDSEVWQDSKIPVLIRIVSNLVSSKPNMPFNVAEIAAAARLTPNHFSNLFHVHTGQSFSTFLTQKRMEMAKRLLSDLTLNVAEVAQLAGYNDPSYFTRRFNQVTGMTPSEYRDSLARDRRKDRQRS